MGNRSLTGDNRVLRGGSWINNGQNLRSAYRNHNEPSKRNDNIGFRLALAQRAAAASTTGQIVIPSEVMFASAKSKAANTLVAHSRSRANACWPADSLIASI